MPGRWWKVARVAALGIVVAFGAVQLIPVDRTNPPVRSDVDAPAEVEEILRRACYDCHSHETRWPWYSRIAPVSWWVADHVRSGRGDLNFSDWPVLDFELQELSGRDIEKQISKGEMPLPSYELLHPEARLDDEERRRLVEWARSLRGAGDFP